MPYKRHKFRPIGKRQSVSQSIVDYMVQLSFPKELDLRHYSFDKLQQDIYKIRLTFSISYFNRILKKT